MRSGIAMVGTAPPIGPAIAEIVARYESSIVSSPHKCAKFHRTQGWLALKSRSQKLKTHQLAGYRQPISKLTVTEHIPGFITGAAGLATSAKAAGRLVSLDARKRRAHAR